MARDPSVLSSSSPIAIAPANPFIAHVQLRDLLICPREQGLVNYVANRAIVEQDLHAPGAPTRVLAQLDFIPNSLTSLSVGDDTLIAAGGQETELHLSYHSPSTSSSPRTKLVWDYEARLSGSINNSVLLTSLSLAESNESSIEPRVGISNNDGSIRLYDVPLRVQSSRRKLAEVGTVRLDVPINHSSISPDGRTLLSVGDSNKVYFHRIAGGARLSFQSITTLSIPAPDLTPFGFSASSLVASFSTAFSGDGSKFAVASQEGVVAVWDVRSTKPLKVFQTDKTRGLGGGLERTLMGNGASAGWLSDDPWEWTRGTRAPGWCVRSVKFNGGEGARLGREVMAFTEHTSLVHVVDARTFETHDIIRVPTILRPEPRRRLRQSSAPSLIAPSSADLRTSSSSPSSAPSASAAQQRRIQRNLIRRLLPVSNARQTPSASGSGSASSSRRPANIRVTRPATADGGPSSSTLSSSSSSGPSFSPSARSAIVQALGDAFRIPASAYSAPASIGDSTWRTLNDEIPVGPFGRRSAAGSLTTSGTASPVDAADSSTPPMPSLQALANYVLEPAPDERDLSEQMVVAREDEGALTRRIRREERALRRGLPLFGSGPGMAEDDESSSSGSGSGRSVSDVTEYAGTVTGGATGNARRRLRSRHRGLRGPVGGVDGEDGIVVVPDLGDRDVESEVHALLAVHGIESRFGPHRSGVSDEEDEDAMRDGEVEDGDVDLDEGYEDGYGGYATETDRDTNTGSAHGDYEYQMYGRRSRRRAAMARMGLTSGNSANFDEMEEAEEEDETVERMDVDLDEMGDAEEREEHVDADGDADVDVDGEGEEDADCLSTANSRSASPSIMGSPSGSATRSTLSNGGQTSTTTATAGPSVRHGAAGTRSNLGREYKYEDDEYDYDYEDWESGGAYYSGSSSASSSGSGSGSKQLPNMVYYDDLDIAGLCFDPYGERMYVAGVGMSNVDALSPGGVGYHSMFAGAFGSPPMSGDLGGAGGDHGVVIEWGVRGAEKRFWVDEGWM